MGGALRALPEVAARVGPVTLAAQRLLAVDPALVDLLPEPGLRRGATLRLAGGPGVTTLALALTAAASQAGAWVAAVDLPDLGVAAADRLGVVTDRLALVPFAGAQWATVAAALLESMDVLLLAPTTRVAPADARRLAARARERGAVVVVLPARSARAWPEATDLQLTVTASRWEGLGAGHGHLQGRLVEVDAGGRRSASRPRRARLWLPGPDGRVAAAPARREEAIGVPLAGAASG